MLLFPKSLAVLLVLHPYLHLVDAKCLLIRHRDIIYQVKEDPTRTICKSGVILQDGKSSVSYCFVEDRSSKGAPAICTAADKDGLFTSPNPFSSSPVLPTLPVPNPGPSQTSCPSVPMPRDAIMDSRSCYNVMTQQIAAAPARTLCRARCTLEATSPPQMIEYKCVCTTVGCAWVTQSVGGIVTPDSPVAKCAISPQGGRPDVLMPNASNPMANLNDNDAALSRRFPQLAQSEPDLPIPPEQPIPPEEAIQPPEQPESLVPDSSQDQAANQTGASPPPSAEDLNNMNRNLPPNSPRNFQPAKHSRRRHKDAPADSGDTAGLPPAVNITLNEKAGEKSANASAAANGTDTAGGESSGGKGKGKDPGDDGKSGGKEGATAGGKEGAAGGEEGVDGGKGATGKAADGTETEKAADGAAPAAAR